MKRANIIVVGAGGQVGSAIVGKLHEKGIPVTAIIRNQNKAEMFANDIRVQIADVFNVDSLIKAFEGGDTVFLLTPESFSSNDVLGDARRMIDNYRYAVEHSGVRRVVGLSSMGAQLGEGTGNLMISHWLEKAFEGLSVKTTFIRPAYYFSNWLAYKDVAEKYGILPTFFNPIQQIEMISPQDVAQFAASILMDSTLDAKVYEIAGPEKYSTLDVANVFADCLEINVIPNPIPSEQWLQTLTEAGFTEDAARNMIDMTKTLTDRNDETPNENIIRMKTKLRTYFRRIL